MGMREEIDAALQAHAAWRKHFKDILYGHVAFDLDIVSATDRCEFGRWLEHEGRRLLPGKLPDEIREAHEHFHRIAAGLIEKIRQKRFDEARRDIAAEGILNQASARLSYLLLKASVREPGRAAEQGRASPEATPHP